MEPKNICCYFVEKFSCSAVVGPKNFLIEAHEFVFDNCKPFTQGHSISITAVWGWFVCEDGQYPIGSDAMGTPFDSKESAEEYISENS